MELGLAILFVALAGLTVCGLVKTLLQLATGVTLTFSQPFISRERPGLSIAAAVSAGPYMILNDAITLYRLGRAGAGSVAGLLLVLLVWVMSLGVLVTELAVILSAL